MEARYMLGESRGKIDHLLFMIDLKLYDKTMQGGDSLVQTVRIFSNDIMSFRISKCAMLEMKRGKVLKNNKI